MKITRNLSYRAFLWRLVRPSGRQHFQYDRSKANATIVCGTYTWVHSQVSAATRVNARIEGRLVMAEC